MLSMLRHAPHALACHLQTTASSRQAVLELDYIQATKSKTQFIKSEITQGL